MAKRVEEVASRSQETEPVMEAAGVLTGGKARKPKKEPAGDLRGAKRGREPSAERVVEPLSEEEPSAGRRSHLTEPLEETESVPVV